MTAGLSCREQPRRPRAGRRAAHVVGVSKRAASFPDTCSSAERRRRLPNPRVALCEACAPGDPGRGSPGCGFSVGSWLGREPGAKPTAPAPGPARRQPAARSSPRTAPPSLTALPRAPAPLPGQPPRAAKRGSVSTAPGSLGVGGGRPRSAAGADGSGAFPQTWGRREGDTGAENLSCQAAVRPPLGPMPDRP